MRKVAMSSDAQTATVERKLRTEYDEMIRVLKASHEAEMRRVGTSMNRQAGRKEYNQLLSCVA